MCFVDIRMLLPITFYFLFFQTSFTQNHTIMLCFLSNEYVGVFNIYRGFFYQLLILLKKSLDDTKTKDFSVSQLNCFFFFF